MSESAHFLGAASASAVNISLVGVPNAQGAIVQYTTLPANQPNTYGNKVYVWQTTENVVPWEIKPDGETAVEDNTPASTTPAIFPFQDAGYIIGWAVAPVKTAVCATVYVPQGKQNDPKAWQYANLTANVVYVGKGFVQVQYNGLAAYKPQTNKNWIGIWAGNQVPWSGDPIKRVDIASDAPPSGYVYMTGLQLLIGVSYVVGYFMVDPKSGRTALAAASTFTVAQQ